MQGFLKTSKTGEKRGKISEVRQKMGIYNGWKILGKTKPGGQIVPAAGRTANGGAFSQSAPLMESPHTLKHGCFYNKTRAFARVAGKFSWEIAPYLCKVSVLSLQTPPFSPFRGHCAVISAVPAGQGQQTSGGIIMAKGENIFKRKDGRWEARYRGGAHHGELRLPGLRRAGEAPAGVRSAKAGASGPGCAGKMKAESSDRGESAARRERRAALLAVLGAAFLGRGGGSCGGFSLAGTFRGRKSLGGAFWGSFLLGEDAHGWWERARRAVAGEGGV